MSANLPLAPTAIVIVNYRTPGLVIDCLRSLLAEPVARIVVADNASGDDSVAQIRSAIEAEGWISTTVLALDQNGGFAAGNNAAIREVLADPAIRYVWLLNPDTIVRPGAVAPLVEFLEGHPRAGIIGGRLEYPDGQPQTSAFRFPSLRAELEDTIRIGLVSRLLRSCRVPMLPRKETHEADWVSGASLMVRRTVLEQVGLMDDGYFLYFEETDFCRQVRRAGWEIWHEPTSRVVHLEGQSTGVTGAKLALKRRPSYWFDSRARYWRKNHGRLKAMIADLVFMAGFSIWRFHRWVRRKPDPDPPHLLGDFIRHAVTRWIRRRS